jgi:hypothetical protein
LLVVLSVPTDTAVATTHRVAAVMTAAEEVAAEEEVMAVAVATPRMA